MAERDEQQEAGRDAPGADLLIALVRGSYSAAVVRAALAIVEGDPLAAAGCFRGALLRGLMEVDGSVWGRHASLYERYRVVLRASAAARRRLTPTERMEFWSALDEATVRGRRRPAAGDAPAG